MAEREEKAKKEAAEESRFTKEQLIKSERYKNSRDILDVVLEEGALYSHGEAKSRIEKFLKGRVN